MPTDIKLKNSVTATNAPTSLQQGEVAINITDKKVWVGNAATTPVLLLGSGADGTFTNLTVSGVASFADGTVLLPSITNIGDTNTGIYFPSADTIAFTEGGVESMRIDASGNVGIGTTTPNKSSSNKAVTLNNASGYVAYEIAVADAEVWRIASNGSAGVFDVTAGTQPRLFWTNGAERMRIDSSGNVGIGTSSPSTKLTVAGATLINTGGTVPLTIYGTAGLFMSIPWGRNASEARLFTSNSPSQYFAGTSAGDSGIQSLGTANLYFGTEGAAASVFMTNNTERMRIDSSGNVLVGTTSAYSKFCVTTTNGNLGITGGNTSGGNKVQSFGTTTTSNGYLAFEGYDREYMRITSGGQLQVATTNDGPAQNNVTGFTVNVSGVTEVSASNTNPFFVNRAGNDGGLVSLRQAGTQEGDISVSGTTVSYNGGHLARWSQLPDNSKDDTILKGTVLTNLDDMCVWTKDGEQLENEQLNKMKVSDVEGDTNVAGVFVNWTRDEDCNSDDMNIAMTGDMIIRIADGVVVQKGDLLMSAGDGTAKPQGDDIVRSKTIAKVTSNYVTCTYADGSYCVPCVLMAC